MALRKNWNLSAIDGKVVEFLFWIDFRQNIKFINQSISSSSLELKLNFDFFHQKKFKNHRKKSQIRVYSAGTVASNLVKRGKIT